MNGPSTLDPRGTTAVGGISDRGRNRPVFADSIILDLAAGGPRRSSEVRLTAPGVLDTVGHHDRPAPMIATSGSFEDGVFGPLVPSRQCGNCVACCSEITIDDPKLAKPPRKLCVHCTGKGCAIYSVRPSDCRTWFCLWRRIENLPNSLRPDRCGMLTSVVENMEAQNPLARIYLIVQWLDGRPIQKSEAADELLAALRRYGLPVWVGSGDRMSLHFPRQEIALHLIDGTTPPPVLAQEVSAWSSRLPTLSRLKASDINRTV